MSDSHLDWRKVMRESMNTPNVMFPYGDGVMVLFNKETVKHSNFKFV